MFARAKGADYMDGGERRARLFLAVAQSNAIGLAFGLTLAQMTPLTDPAQAAVIFTGWMAATWWVWRSVRRVFWPEDFDGG